MFPTGVPGVGRPVNPSSLLPGGGLNISLANYDNSTGALNSLSTGAKSSWNSGVMTSMTGTQGFAQQYGYFEMVAQFPGPSLGTWPGFWMLPSGSPGAAEIDILEQYGSGPNWTFCSVFHDYSPANNTTGTCSNAAPATQTTAYHAYGFLWTAEIMAIYVDGVQTWSVPTAPIFKQPFYILVDMGIGSGWPTTATPSPSILMIKSIKAWQAPQ
jgi:beta-glucanase (GH16 family)